MSQESLTFDQALSRATDLLSNTSKRIIIGIAGKPGSGKSTLSSFLLKHLPIDSVSLVPMDGFHLSNKVLEELGRHGRKGAPDTFDSLGYLELLHRIAHSSGDIYFPIFYRELEESIAAEGVVTARTKLVLTEGNYLLHTENGWGDVVKTLTESWYVDVDDSARLSRLVDRHYLHGKSPEEAHDWAYGTDEENARLVERSRDLADVIVTNTP